jgi:heme acquisition protein HasR
MILKKGKAGAGVTASQRRPSAGKQTGRRTDDLANNGLSNNRLAKSSLSTHRMAMRPSRLWLAIAMVLSGQYALAEQNPAAASEPQSKQQPDAPLTPVGVSAAAADAAYTLDTIQVTATPEEETKIGSNAGASKEDIERRGASHMSDLVESISGVSANSLYSRPEISVGIQGVAGHGRVSQSLEGVNQNFHAFTYEFGQTGSLLVDPQFLSGIDVTRGGSSGTDSLGSLGSSVDFRYLDLDDILQPGEDFGGMVRLKTGIGDAGNGQKPSGTFFLGGRSEDWEWVFGASHSKNDAYKVGSNISKHDLMNNASSEHMDFARSLDIDVDVDNSSRINCRYAGVNGYVGMNNCGFTADQAEWLKEAADSGALTGTQKQQDSQMLRLRRYFNDPADQYLELFATYSSSSYETDQQPSVWVPLNENSTEDDYWTDGDAYWHERPWSVKAELDSLVVNLKYGGSFSALFNPEVQLYYESQNRKQNWSGYSGSYAAGEPLHYYVDNGSYGVKINNASHFDLASVGLWRLDAGLDLRQAEKTVDSETEDQWYVWYMQEQGYDIQSMTFDPDSTTDTAGFSLALSTEGNGPWQGGVGLGIQHVSMEVHNPSLAVGNVSQAGTMYTKSYYQQLYLSQGYSIPEMIPMAEASAAAALADFRIDQDVGISSTRIIDDSAEHQWTLKSANLGLQYTRPGTGLTSYASASYSERAPTSNEMYMYGAIHRQSFTGNPDLKPEENLSLQMGLSYLADNWLTNNDQIGVGLNIYYNKINNYIVYGYIMPENTAYNEDANLHNSEWGYNASVNNLEPVIRKGVEFNASYQQPLFYLRGNLTVPIRHDNKQCWWQSPSGESYYSSTDDDGNTVYTDYGKGEKVCGSSWNWAEVGAIEPVRSTLTLALTPMDGKLEVGTTLHYRGQQRAAYWYDVDAQSITDLQNQEGSSEGIPDESQFIVANLWPSVTKVDLFVNYQFNQQFKAGVYAANLTDQMDATTTTWGYNFQPGRTVTANMEYRF